MLFGMAALDTDHRDTCSIAGGSGRFLGHAGQAERN